MPSHYDIVSTALTMVQLFIDERYCFTLGGTSVTGKIKIGYSSGSYLTVGLTALNLRNLLY